LKGRHEIAVSKVLSIYGFVFSIFGTSGVISTIHSNLERHPEYIKIDSNIILLGLIGSCAYSSFGYRFKAKSYSKKLFKNKMP